jgi:hypothetical protein
VEDIFWCDTGIIKDAEISHLEINFLALIAFYDILILLGIQGQDPRYLSNWIGNYFLTHLLLLEHRDPFSVESRINEYFASSLEQDS